MTSHDLPCSGRKSFLPSDAFAESDLINIITDHDLIFYSPSVNWKLLECVCDKQGCVETDSNYGYVYNIANYRGTVVIRTDLLKWKSSSSKSWFDFPNYLINHVIALKEDKTRAVAERYAHHLLKTAYSGNWDQVAILVHQMKSGKPCTP